MKKIFDPLHGFIRLSDEESLIVATRPFQRLRYINQLGIAYLVYPGAVHKRFEHSLGVMHLASMIFDHLLEGCTDHAYRRAIVRAAALCHDMGHLPFSHTAEKALLCEKGHENWTLKLIESDHLMPAFEAYGKRFGKDPVKVREDVSKLAVKRGEYESWQHILCEIITGDFFGADRIDYLLRDARSTGVAYGLFDYHQLIEMLRVWGDEKTIGIEENGVESCEALLLARYFMFRRIYQYSSVKSYTYHLSCFMKERYSDFTIESFLNLTDNEVLAEIGAAARDGDSHAAALMQTEPKCLAYALNKASYEKIEKDIPTEPIEQHSSQLLNFPVLMRDGSVKKGFEISTVSLKQTAAYWAFVDAGREESFYQSL